MEPDQNTNVPVVPIPPSEPVQPVGGQPVINPTQQPTPQTFFAPPVNQPVISDVANQSNRLKIKTFMIVGVIITILFGLGLTVWLLFFKGITLTGYSNELYSISVPESYQKKEFGSEVELTKQDGESVYTSMVLVTPIEIPSGVSRDKYVSEMYSEFTKENIESGDLIPRTGESFVDVDIAKNSRDNMDINIASGKFKRDGEVTGTFKYAVIASKKRMYIISIEALNRDSDLAMSASSIINSFKEN